MLSIFRYYVLNSAVFNSTRKEEIRMTERYAIQELDDEHLSDIESFWRYVKRVSSENDASDRYVPANSTRAHRSEIFLQAVSPNMRVAYPMFRTPQPFYLLRNAIEVIILPTLLAPSNTFLREPWRSLKDYNHFSSRMIFNFTHLILLRLIGHFKRMNKKLIGL